MLAYKIMFFIRIRDKRIKRNYYIDAEILHIFNMLIKIDDSLFQCFHVLYGKFIFRDSAIVFECAYRCHNNYGVRNKACFTAFDIKEFLRSQIRSESGLGNYIISKFKCHLCRTHTVASVCYVSKRTSVNNSRCILKCLDYVRFHRIFEEGSHSTGCLDISGCNRIARVIICHNYPGKPFLKVCHICGEAQNCHNLRRNSYYEMIFPYESVGLASESDNNISECTVIHIHTSLPYNLSCIDPARISLLDVVIYHCCKEIVGACNRMKISGKMKIKIFHRHHL